MALADNLTDSQRQARIAGLVPTSWGMLPAIFAGYIDKAGDLRDAYTMRDALEYERGQALDLMNVTIGLNKFEAAKKYDNLTIKLKSVNDEILLLEKGLHSPTADTSTPTGTLPSAYDTDVRRRLGEWG